MRSFRGGAISVLIAGAFLFACLPLRAAEPEQASGKFQSKGISFDVKGAYAYWSRTSDEGPRIEVAVSNAGFVPAAFDSFYDPRPVIDHDFIDEETGVVYFQFEPNGKYRGMSYMLESGNGCGFCSDSEVRSTVRIDGQHMKGQLAYKGDTRSFDIQIDVPVAPKEWGKPIQGDGGEIGSAFRKYNAAMQSGDQKAIVASFDKHNREKCAKYQKEGKLDQYIEYRTDKRHWNMKSASIVGGYVRENQAVLLVKASSALLDHFHGQVTLNKEDGQWKISDEVYEIGE